MKKPVKKFYKKKVSPPTATPPPVAKPTTVVPPAKTVYSAKKKPNATRLVVPPAILLSILLLVGALYFFLQLFLRQLLFETKKQTYTPLSYPVFSLPEPPTISAQSAIIMDDTSKAILYEKNSQFRFSMASTTKLMTALVALSYFHPDDVLTVSRNKVEGTIAGFYPGEKLRFSEVMYAMLLPSDNDAAYLIADNYPGGVDNFVAAMNEKAYSLGLYNTHYGDPAGLVDDDDFTNVKDLARLTSSAISNPTIAQVTSTKEKMISDVSNRNHYQLKNSNKLLGLYGVNGVKTGTTEGAGEVLITSSVYQGHTFIIIVMKSADRFADTEMLLKLLAERVVFISPRYPFVPTIQ